MESRKSPWPALENALTGMSGALLDPNPIEAWRSYISWLWWLSVRVEAYIENNHIRGEQYALHSERLQRYLQACERVCMWGELPGEEGLGLPVIRQAYIRAKRIV